jgi:hypothetical protein
MMRTRLATLATIIALSLYQAGSAALVLYHPLDEAALPATYVNQGTAGSVHDVQTAGSGASVAPGKLGNAVSLPGAGGALNQVSTTDIPVSGDGVRTVSVWINAPATTGSIRSPLTFGINSTNNANPGRKFDVDVDASGFFEVGVGGGRQDGTGQTPLAANAWHLLTATLPASASTGANMLRLLSELDLYVNGQPAAASAPAGKEIGTATGVTTIPSFAIGRAANSLTQQLFNGLIDDVAIWNEDFTADEVRGLYDVGNISGYNAGQFDLMKQVHDAGSGSVVINGLPWSYATGLSSTSLTAGGAIGDMLVLDAAAGTGLTAIPEPSAGLLAVAAALLFLRRRS